MRFVRTALYAHEHGFPVISSSLGISRWKDMNQITDCGLKTRGWKETRAALEALVAAARQLREETADASAA
jgi:predicted adenine nucleotide alpha hydrolase (AANH) superfamily ATPase